jgi:DNA-binding response OmpR family regulator
MEAGFDGHLVKPVDQGELEERLRIIAVKRQMTNGDRRANLGS